MTTTTTVIIFTTLTTLPISQSKPPKFPCQPPHNLYPFCNTTLPIQIGAQSLISELTISDKINRLCNNDTGIPRLGIPPYQWWSESLHGIAVNGPGGPIPAATGFPQVIVTSSSFNRTLWRLIASAIAVEARAMYNSGQSGLTFWEPTINIFRDPRWGRGHETPGEDPAVVGAYAVEYVSGFQGEGLDIVCGGSGDNNNMGCRRRVLTDGAGGGDELMVSACCKHFSAYDLEKDVKSSNILLDDSMCAKVADFGFSKYAPQEGDSSNPSLEVRGTAGYLDPAYYSTQHLSAKSDAFSYGVVLLEIITGREPLNMHRPRKEWGLVEWAKPFIRNSRIEEIVHPSIKQGYRIEAMWRVVEVALACTEPLSTYRPSMIDIVRELEDALIIENNASEYMKSLDSFGGSNRFSIERPIVNAPLHLPTPTPSETKINSCLNMVDDQ